MYSFRAYVLQVCLLCQSMHPQTHQNCHLLVIHQLSTSRNHLAGTKEAVLIVYTHVQCSEFLYALAIAVNIITCIIMCMSIIHKINITSSSVWFESYLTGIAQNC